MARPPQPATNDRHLCPAVLACSGVAAIRVCDAHLHPRERLAHCARPPLAPAGPTSAESVEMSAELPSVLCAVDRQPPVWCDCVHSRSLNMPQPRPCMHEGSSHAAQGQVAHRYGLPSSMPVSVIPYRSSSFSPVHTNGHQWWMRWSGSGRRVAVPHQQRPQWHRQGVCDRRLSCYASVNRV